MLSESEGWLDNKWFRVSFKCQKQKFLSDLFSALLNLEKFAKSYGFGVNISAAAKLSPAISA